MDEEQKSNIDPIAEISQRPKQKINVDSFFNRSADAESITAISLKLASVIEQIDVMKTEIKEIATYITVEHKIEKDLREDRLFEEQDAKQKKEMKDKVLAKGEQVPKTAKGETPQEESKGGGGGFFSGLMKVVGGLGLVAGLAALSPIILKVMGAALIGLVVTAIAKPLYNWVKGTFDKLKNFLDKTFKPIEKVPIVGKPLKTVLVGGLLGGLPGIAIAAASSIFNALKGAEKGNDGGGGGGTSGPTSGGNMNLEENNAGKDMSDTLKKKGVIKDTEDSVPAESFSEYRNRTGNVEVDEVEEVKEEKKNLITSESGRKYTKEQIIKMSKDYKVLVDKEKAASQGSGVELTRTEYFDKKALEIKLNDIGVETRSMEFGSVEEVESFNKAITDYNNLVGNETKEAPRFGDVGGLIEITPVNEDPNLSMNNTSVVVPKNEPQVSSAEIKVTGTTLAYVRSLQNPYLSITNKKIAPELSRIG